MAWRRPGDKPLSEPRMESLLTHICVTRPQWVNVISTLSYSMLKIREKKWQFRQASDFSSLGTYCQMFTSLAFRIHLRSIDLLDETRFFNNVTKETGVQILVYVGLGYWCTTNFSFKIGTTCHAKTGENWLGLVNSCIYYAHQTHEIYQLWNPLSKTVLSKNSSIYNKGPVDIWNDRKVGPVNTFPKFWHNNFNAHASGEIWNHLLSTLLLRLSPMIGWEITTLLNFSQAWQAPEQRHFHGQANWSNFKH